jgi:hypothetical protein
MKKTEARKSRATVPLKRNDTVNRGTVDVKWLVLNFTLLWQTVLKCVPLTMVYHGVWTMDCHKEIIVPQITIPWIVKSLNLRVLCQGVIPVVAKQYTLESGLLRVYSCLG